MFVENIKNWAHAVKPHAGGSVHLEARRPASRRQLGKVERELGRPIPEPIRDLLRKSASRLNFWWDLRDGIMPLGGPDAPSGGYLEFGIEGIAQLDAILGGWVSEGAPSWWAAAFPFLGVPNGDLIALDLGGEDSRPPVIYLNHEEPGGSIRLAESLEVFLERWTQLGCVGPEIWVLRHFLVDGGNALAESSPGTATSELSSTCPNALEWRRFFNQ